MLILFWVVWVACGLLALYGWRALPEDKGSPEVFWAVLFALLGPCFMAGVFVDLVSELRKAREKEKRDA